MVRDFAERHGLTVTDTLFRESIAIESGVIANASINRGYSALDRAALSDPAIGILLNLLHRNLENVEAAIVAFVTGSGAAAEVIARASTELSINILYILAGDRTPRLSVISEPLEALGYGCIQPQRFLLLLMQGCDQPRHFFLEGRVVLLGRGSADITPGR